MSEKHESTDRQMLRIILQLLNKGLEVQARALLEKYLALELSAILKERKREDPHGIPPNL